MEKTIIIHLNQIVFNIEEKAYQKLSQYLDSIKKHYKNTSDGDEIVSDIEASAADHFNELLGKTKKVITLEDVEKLISSMGSVNDISQDDPNDNEKETEDLESKPVRKLFRNPQNKVLGGVISGIANYFNFDVTILRIVIALMLFIPQLGGPLIILYLIMWAIIPEAKTAVDKIIMKGEEVNLNTLENEINSKHSLKKNEKNGFAKIIEFPIEITRQTASFVFKIFSKIIPLISIIIGLGIVVGCSVGIAAMVTVFLNYFMIYGNLPFMPETSQVLRYVFFGSVFFVSLFPMLAVMILGISLIRRKWSFKLISSITMFCMWLIALITLITVSFRIFPNMKTVGFENFNISTKNNIYIENPIEDIKSEQKLNYFDSISGLGVDNINVYQSSEYKYVINGSKENVNNTLIEIKNGSLNISSKNHQYPLLVSIDLYTPFIKSVSVLGETKLNIKDLNSINLNLSATGNSSIIASGSVNNLNITSMGESVVDTKNLVSKTAKISSLGDSNVIVNASTSLNISALGESKIEYLGSPKITKSVLGESRVEQYQIEK